MTTAVDLVGEPVEGVLVDPAEESTAITPYVDPRPSDRNPYWVYIRGLRGETSRRTMQGALDRIAHLLTGAPLPRKKVLEPLRPGQDKRAPRRVLQEAVPVTIRGDVIPWEHLRYAHTAALATLVAAQDWSPTYANTHLVAVSRVLKEAWRLGLMSGEDYKRAADALSKIEGTREMAGRMLDRAEIAAHLDACRAEDTPKGIRDAALLAIAHGSGARRAELVAADLADWNATTGLLLKGKRNKQRRVPLPPWTAPYLAAWLRVRGMRPGPLFTRCNRWGGVSLDRLTGQTVVDVLRERARLAGTAPATPHDIRRTYASTLLDDPETGLEIVQALLGHESPTTTSRYDRRGEKSRVAAVNRLPDPHSS
jgi:integrase